MVTPHNGEATHIQQQTEKSDKSGHDHNRNPFKHRLHIQCSVLECTKLHNGEATQIQQQNELCDKYDHDHNENPFKHLHSSALLHYSA